MNASMIVFAMKEAHRLIDSAAYVGPHEDSEIVKADLLRAIDAIQNLQKTVAVLMTEFTA